MKNLSKLLVIVLMMCYVTISAQKEFSLLSPDKKIEVKVSVGEKIEFSVLKNGKLLITSSTITMNVNANVMLGVNAKVKNTKTNSVNQILQREVSVRTITN
ncbi:MAG: Glycoside hydrolase 97 [Ignavibacteria bacterium]|nr:MAG: Glycoside hydrolase 97 [Ignavibacteria bacterium]